MSEITVTKVREAIRAAVKRFPDRHNPVVPGTYTCLYTAHPESDDEMEAPHCIAGQVLADLGLPVPGWTVEAGLAELHHEWEHGDDVRDHFTGLAWRTLLQAQEVFDTVRNGTPRVWREALDVLGDFEDV